MKFALITEYVKTHLGKALFLRMEQYLDNVGHALSDTFKDACAGSKSETLYSIVFEVQSKSIRTSLNACLL